MMTSPNGLKSYPVRLLLVDDNQFFLDLLTVLLQGYLNQPVITAARSGSAALALAETLQPHLALVDLTLPDLSGLETITCLRHLLPDSGIVALTMLPDEPPYREAVLLAGAHAVVEKSQLLSNLLPVIRWLRPALFVSETS